MRKPVCLLAPDHADALEQRGVVPDCQHHDHIKHAEADKLIGVEGWGVARTVFSQDGRRRITRIPSILTFASRQSGIGGGPQVLQAVFAELH